MSKSLPKHLSHMSALALIPPSSITAPIEAIRRAHDKQFNRWPPHINLLYPFLSSPSEKDPSPRVKEGIRARIEKAVCNIEPFRVVLNGDLPGTFSHGRNSKTVWLGPSTRDIHQLQIALQEEFLECDVGKRPFRPHLTVGQASSKDEASSLSDAVKKSVFDFVSVDKESVHAVLEWDVDQVFVIEREGHEGRFEVIGAIKLGGKTDVQSSDIGEESTQTAI